MKHKNSIFIFIALSIMFSLAKIFFIKDFSVEREKLVVADLREPINNQDLKKIESFLKPQNTQSVKWESLVDYREKIEQLITKENAKEYFLLAHNNLPDMVTCLRKDYCGMDKATVDAPYFDNERTPAHLLVARLLNVIAESIKNDSSLASLVDWNLVREISGLSGDELKAASMNLLINVDKKNSGRDSLFAVAESYTGEAKAKFYSQMALDIEPAERPVFVQALEKSLERDDPHTVISLVENLKTYKLSENELTTLGKSLCRFKEQKENWMMIVSLMKNVDQNFENNCL